MRGGKTMSNMRAMGRKTDRKKEGSWEAHGGRNRVAKRFGRWRSDASSRAIWVASGMSFGAKGRPGSGLI